MRTNTKARTHARPSQRDEIVCFYPKYGDWLTLDQYQYLKSLNGVEPGTAALKQDPVREEVSASGLSEVAIGASDDLLASPQVRSSILGHLRATGGHPTRRSRVAFRTTTTSERTFNNLAKSESK